MSDGGDWSAVRYRCRDCDNIHHPDERPDHAFLLNTSVCPSCGSQRASVHRDFEGIVC